MYAFYILHGGGIELEALKIKHPLMKTPSLQSAVADFKRRVRLVAKVSADEGDEWHLATCTNISNRLQPMAIASRQAAIQGMPAMTMDEKIYIAQALLAMRGVNQKTHKAMHAEGKLNIPETVRVHGHFTLLDEEPEEARKYSGLDKRASIAGWAPPDQKAVEGDSMP